MKLDIHGTPAENLQRLITDCGVSPHKVSLPSPPIRAPNNIEVELNKVGARTCARASAETFRRQDYRLVLFQAQLRPIPDRRAFFQVLYVVLTIHDS